MDNLKTWAAAAAMVALTGAAQAALVSLGDGTVKDTKSNLIWLQDWNVNGQGTWPTQDAWAQGLTFAGSSDWRLPSIFEVGRLVFEYGNLPGSSPFTNVQTGYYWSGSRVDPISEAWEFALIPSYFSSNLGLQQIYRNSAVAVRTYDVTASVPEPQTLALVLLALGATVVARKRRSR